MNALIQDLRYAVRTLAKSPGFTLVAVLTLALGIGASTAVYTALERVVLDPLPYPDANRLVQLKSSVPKVGPGTEWDVSEGAWFFFGREAHTIDGLGAYRRGGANLVGPDGPERARTAQVSAHTLQLLGARAIRGRLIDEHDDVPGGVQVAVVSHRFWQRRLGGDDRVIGTTISIYEQPVEIIGVMAPGVDLPPANGMPAALLETDVWLPLRLNPAGPFWNAHTQFRTIARLKRGVTLDAAQAEFASLTMRLPEAVPNAYTRAGMQRSGFATRVYSLKSYVVGEVSKTLWILFGAVGVVLLIVYANVANLFLVRAEARRREVIIRTALGADATAIARHFLAESLVLALAGGVLALVLASWGVDALTHLAPDGVPRLQALKPDGSVILFALGLVLVAAAVLAALPALRARRAVRAGELVLGDRGPTVGRESQRVRSGLVVAQVALALVLLVGAGLLVESMQRLRAVDLGIRPHGVLTAQLYLPYQRYDSLPKMWRFYSATLERVRAVPGVEAAGLTSDVPLEGGYGCTVQGFEDPAVRQRIADAGGTLCAGQEPTSPGYFEAMGIPVIRGRALTQDDLEHPERGSVVVSKAFADRFWPGEDPIGKGVGPNGYTSQQFYHVVGVVGDVYAGSAAGARGLAVYYPVLRIPGTSGWSPNPMTLGRQDAIRRPGFDSAGPADCDPGSGPIDPTVRGGRDGDDRRPVDGAVVVRDGAARDRGVDGAAARGRRTLWRDLLPGKPAYRGDRDSDGAGRGAAPGRASRGRRFGKTCLGRSELRCCRRARIQPRPARAPLRRSADSAARISHRGSGARGCVGAGGLSARSARGARRSDDRVEE